MDLQEIISKPHSELNPMEQVSKIFYINELLRLDEQFDNRLRFAMRDSLKKGTVPSNKVTLADFTQAELLDLTNPIETNL